MNIIERQLGTGEAREDAPHRHDQGQFILVRRGILQGHVERSSWVLQPDMAAWVPGGVLHWGVVSKGVELAVLYLDNALCQHFPVEAGPLLTTPLMVALCERLLPGTQGQESPQRRQRMMEMLIGEIAEAPVAGLVLPLPEDPRLKRLTEALMAKPSQRLTLAEWGGQVGASERTLARRFLSDTGLTFRQWHDRFLLAEALRGLADGSGNARLSRTLGFASADSFGHWFRRMTGHSLGAFVDNLSRCSRKSALDLSMLG